MEMEIAEGLHSYYFIDGEFCDFQNYQFDTLSSDVASTSALENSAVDQITPTFKVEGQAQSQPQPLPIAFTNHPQQVFSIEEKPQQKTWQHQVLLSSQSPALQKREHGVLPMQPSLSALPTRQPQQILQVSKVKKVSNLKPDLVLTEADSAFHESLGILCQKKHFLNRIEVITGFDACNGTPIFKFSSNNDCIILNAAEMKRFINSPLLKYLADNFLNNPHKREDSLSSNQNGTCKTVLSRVKCLDKYFVELRKTKLSSHVTNKIMFDQSDAISFALFKTTFDNDFSKLVVLSAKVVACIKSWRGNFEAIENELAGNCPFSFSSLIKMTNQSQMHLRELYNAGYESLYNDYLHWFVETSQYKVALFGVK